jgi:hypothetical protein
MPKKSFPVYKKCNIGHCHAVVSTVKLFWPFAEFTAESRRFKLSLKEVLMAKQTGSG